MPGEEIIFPMLAWNIARIIPTTYLRFTQVIYSSPDKITNYILIVIYQLPVLKSIAGVRFGIDNNAGRDPLMVRWSPVQLIIISANIMYSHSRIKNFPVDIPGSVS